MKLLSWQRNRGSLAVAVLAHRAATRGLAVHLAEAGYLLDDAAAAAAEELGLKVSAGPEPDTPSLSVPRVAVFAGSAIGYPYYAYYAHCLLSLGLVPRLLDAEDLAANALRDVDLLVMPGGFATWGLDRAENVPGLDEQVALFLERGGAVIGSCGGAFYLSEGRPGWLGAIDAKPIYTHEYLQTGAGVVNLRITDRTLGAGLPELVEMPYYHGPAYAGPPRRSAVLATFDALALPSRLMIDNPLEREPFERDLKGRPAVLLAPPDQGRALVFSPHPEMGDFVRKAIALDGYLRKYLPLRGPKVMDETLRFYAGEDSPSYRLVLNAARLLGCFEASQAARQAPGRSAAGSLGEAFEGVEQVRRQVGEALRQRLPELEGALAPLMLADLERLERDWQRCRERLATATNRLDSLLGETLTRLLCDAASALGATAEMPAAQLLLLLELPVRAAAAALRVTDTDQLLEETTARVSV